MLGIDPTQSNQSYSYNFRGVVILSSYTLTFISTGSYLLFKAQTIPEYAQSLYLSITCLYIIMDFIAIQLKIRDMLQLIEKMEEFIQRSKSVKK